jgi:hypothetical protein
MHSLPRQDSRKGVVAFLQPAAGRLPPVFSHVKALLGEGLARPDELPSPLTCLPVFAPHLPVFTPKPPVFSPETPVFTHVNCPKLLSLKDFFNLKDIKDLEALN